MKRKKVILIIIAIFGACILYPFLSFSYWCVRGIFEPMGALRIQRQYETLPSEQLIKKLHSIDPISPYRRIAMTVLTKRKATEAVPDLIKLTKSLNPYTKAHAIRSLGEIGDKRAIPRLLEILKKGKDKNGNYRNALYSLSRISYEPIRPIALELLKRPDGLRNGAVGMLEYVGKKGDLPLLQKMHDNVQGNDVNSRLDRKGLKKAIEAIKKREQL